VQGQEHAGGTGQVCKLFVCWFGLDGFKLFCEQSVLDVPDMAHNFLSSRACLTACVSTSISQYVHQTVDHPTAAGSLSRVGGWLSGWSQPKKITGNRAAASWIKNPSRCTARYPHMAALDRCRFTAHYGLIRIATRHHLRFKRCAPPEWFMSLSGLRHRAHTVTLEEDQV
jgi:hypothetical protein